MHSALPSQMKHSADVHMDLLIAGQTLTVAQLGPDFLILAKEARSESGPAEIRMSIDGKESRWPVCLPEGVRGQRVAIAPSAAKGEKDDQTK